MFFKCGSTVACACGNSKRQDSYEKIVIATCWVSLYKKVSEHDSLLDPKTFYSNIKIHRIDVEFALQPKILAWRYRCEVDILIGLHLNVDFAYTSSKRHIPKKHCVWYMSKYECRFLQKNHHHLHKRRWRAKQFCHFYPSNSSDYHRSFKIH